MSMKASIQAADRKAGRYYATGKRKNAIARVWLQHTDGDEDGSIIINGKTLEDYFGRPVSRMVVNQPFQATETLGKFKIFARVNGGGLSGQAGALRHGISKALQDFDNGHRPILKTAGYLTRDPRVVESKKYGKHKARRSTQFSKR